MILLVDTNVVLDVALDREPFADTSSRVLAVVETSGVKAYLCATTITTIDYLLAQKLSTKATRTAVRNLLDLFEVATVNRAVLEQALCSRIMDFEDAVLEQAAHLAGAGIIVTRNVKDFRRSIVPAMDPPELLAVIDARGAQ